MKKVCMIVQSLFPNDPRVRREAEALEREGVAVDIVCMREIGQPARETYGLITAHRILKVRRKENIARYLLTACRFATAAFFKTARLSARNRFDLIQVHNMPDFLVFAAAAPRLSGTPLLLDLHDLSVELFASKWGEGAKLRLIPLVRWIEKLSCGFANRLLTTSDGFRQRLIDRGIDPAKITIVLNTPDSRIFQFHAEREFVPIREGARLLYHGTVQPRFGILTAIEALARLDGAAPESTLDVYGAYDPVYRETLERRIEELGLQGRVRLHGYQTQENIHRLIGEADIGLVPYHEDDFMKLALSTKTFEYAACGLPIAASRLPSIQTHFDETAVRFATPGDAQSLADAIAGLCADPEARRSLAANARREVEKISDKIMNRRYLDVVYAMAGETRQPDASGPIGIKPLLNPEGDK